MIAELGTEMAKRKMVHWAAQRKIDRRFSPDRAPHFGGLWESVVRKLKQCLRKVAGQEKLTLLELQAVVS